MKIVDRQTFLALPANTLYSKYEPCIFSDIQIKGNTCTSGNDFYYQDIASAIENESSEDFWDTLKLALENKVSLTMDFEYEGRDCLYDAKQLFAVWEKQDVVKLINRLQECLI